MIRASAIEESPPRLPMATLVDMVFLMIFYFLATGTLQPEQAALKISVAPADEQAQAGAGMEIIEVTLTEEGQYLAEGSFAAEGLTEILGNCSDCTVRLKPHAATRHEAIVAALEAVAQAGLEAQLAID